MNYEITNDHHRNSKLIQFFPIGTAQINLPNILTIGRLVYPGMRVVKVESNHFDAIEILNVEEEPKGYVNLLVRDIGTDKIGELTQILDPENKYFIWTLISLEYIEQEMIEWEMMKRIVGT